VVLKYGEGRWAVESVIERVMDTKERLWITLKSTGERWRALERVGERQREEERKGLTAMEREVIGVESSDDQWELLVGESRLYIILCITNMQGEMNRAG
jgi:hypothetical protein